MNESRAAQTAEKLESVDALRLHVRTSEVGREALRSIVVLWVAEAHMCHDVVTAVESRLRDSLKRRGGYGYSGRHDATSVVSQTRRLGC